MTSSGLIGESKVQRPPRISRIKRGGSVWSDERNGRNRPFLKLGWTKLDENVLLKMEGADGGQESRNYSEKFKAKRTIKRDLGRGWDYLPSKLNNGTLTFAIFALFSFRLGPRVLSRALFEKVSYLFNYDSIYNNLLILFL